MNRELIIMLIDDNETDNLITGKIIEMSQVHCSVVNFTSARKALDYIETNSGKAERLPDLIFLDINMPLVNGDQFILELEAMSAYMAKDPRIILLSSYDKTDSIQAKSKNRIIKGLIKPLLKADFEKIAKEFISLNLKVA